MFAFHLTASDMGLLSAAYFYPSFIVALLLLFFIDHVNPGKLLLASLLLSAMGSLLCAMAGTYNVMIVGRLFHGFGLGVLNMVFIKFIFNHFPSKYLATLYGGYLAFAMLTSSGGASFLAALTNYCGWQAIFGLTGAITIVLAVAMFMATRLLPLPPLPLDATANAFEDSGARIRDVLASRNFWLLSMGMGLLYAPIAAFRDLWSVPYLMQVYAGTKQEASSIVGFWSIGMIVGMLLAALLSDRVFKSRKKPVILFSTLYLLTWLIMALNPDGFAIGFLYALFLCMGLFSGAYFIGYAQILENLPNKIVGRIFWLSGICPFVIVATAQQLAGYMRGSFDKVPLRENGKEVLDASGQFIMVFPVQAYGATFWLCTGCVALGLALYCFSKETFIKNSK